MSIPQLLLPKGLKDGYIRVRILDSQNVFKTYTRKVADGRVRIGSQSYDVLEQHVYRVGLFRSPAVDYVEGNAAPISHREKITYELDATENQEKFESHVGRELMNAFSESLFNTTSALLISICVTVGAAVFLYYNFDKQFKALSALITGEVAQ